MFASIWDASWTAPRFVSSIYHEGVGLFTGCLPFFHSGPVGNGDWIPVNQHRWIGPRPRWLSGAAVYARVYSFVCGGAWLCMPTLYACYSLWTTAHLCHSISSLIEFWVLSIIASTAVLRPWLAGCREGRYSCEQVFLTSPSNYYQDTVESYSHGNEHSGWHSASVMCERGHTLFHIRNKKEQFQCSFLNVEIISIDPNCIHARLHKNVIPRNSQNTQFVHTKCIFFLSKKIHASWSQGMSLILVCTMLY